MGVQLDRDKVISKALQNNIRNKSALNMAILAVRGVHDVDGQSTKVGDRVWNGDRISEDRARDVATALGLASYLELQETTQSLWSTLLTNSTLRKKMITLEIDGETSSVRELFKFKNATRQTELTVPMTAEWRLRLISEPGQFLMVILRDQQKHCVITPSKYDFPTQWTTSELCIPEKEYLSFDENEGAGWREIIVLSSTLNVFEKICEQDDIVIDKMAREHLAGRLLNEKNTVFVDKIEFILT